MTDVKKWKLALIAGLAVPALALTACSSDDGDSGAGPDTSSDSASDSSTEDTDSGATSDITFDGAPDGFELTSPGSRLSLDDTGHVVTRHREGPTMFWAITPGEMRDLPADAAELQDGNDDVDHFVCLDYDITYLGEGSDGTNPEDASVVSTPRLSAVGEDGYGANSIFMDMGNTCGIHEADELPSTSESLTVDKTYKASILSFVAKDENAGVDPTGLRFGFQTDIPGLDGAEDIYWN
ncbi:hypothetical protein [Corynebacterium kalidii]|uniref:Lipoprotein n=1 Tax=Corynebacterium kalidii TaxID=2931982 RepID=A0A9X1WGJ2_9CORY|nr:hypothetical protein [Corynebacterium kalidii]MCJ7857768.1 hypothetical protein [Corynebacterium kalidii]